MPETYGPHERAALLVLALAGRDIPNPELVHDHGITLSAAGRAKLNDAGLLKTDTSKRPYLHSITKQGKEWSWRELAEVEAPARSGPFVRAAFEALRQMCRGEFKLPVADLESMIRQVYGELSIKPQDWVRLARLRPKLDGADRTDVDRVLLTMTKTGTVHLAPSSNRKALTAADHEAAIRIGSEDKHLLAIEES